MDNKINFDYEPLFLIGAKFNYLSLFKKGGNIHIKKSHEGKFTDYCGGHVTSECITRGKASSDPAVRKRATFAANARKWKHLEGGLMLFTADNNNLESDSTSTADLKDTFPGLSVGEVIVPEETSVNFTEPVSTYKPYKKYSFNTDIAPQIDKPQLFQAILNWLNIPYVYGGGSRNGIDCSHFVSKVFGDMGKKVSAGSIKEWEEMDHIDLGQARVGDIIFLQGTQKKRAWGLPSHVAIITDISQLPNGQVTVAEASGGKSQVRTWNIDSGYYKNHFLGVGRVRV